MIEREYTIEGIPLLIVYDNIETGREKGTIFFYHGFLGAKENNIDVIRKIANEGYIVCAPDNYNHGKRRALNFYELYSNNNPMIEKEFLKAVIMTAKELDLLITELEKMGMAKRDKIGVTGVSMGGYITYTAIPMVPEIKAAAPIIGSPEYREELPESPHRFIKKFGKVYLLSQTAARDTIVPPQYAREFHKKLEKEYPDYKERFAYIEYPESGHMMEQKEWNKCIDKMIEWFREHL